MLDISYRERSYLVGFLDYVENDDHPLYVIDLDREGARQLHPLEQSLIIDILRNYLENN